MPFIVKTACAKMPGSCKGTYRRVAVIELMPGFTDCAMISERARGVVRIVELWDKVNVGTTHRCAYYRALAEANLLVINLNAGRREYERKLLAALRGEEEATSDL